MSQVWLVTGSSRGLGRCVAESALRAGHQVVATARRPELLHDLVAEHGDAVRAVALDVTDPEAARSAVGTAMTEFGRLDVVVNNAAHTFLAAAEEADVDAVRAQMEGVFFGVFHVSRAALPVMRAQGSGHLVQVTSLGSRIGTPGLASYNAAKWATAGWSSALAAEVGPLGVSVTIVEPGSMRTGFSGPSMPVAPVGDPYRATVGAVAEYLAAQSGQEPVDPALVADAIVRITEVDDPPLHLLLGPDAVQMGAAVAAELAVSDAAWSELGNSTAFATRS